MKHSTVFMLFIDLMINLALNIGVKSVFFFKEFGTHSFNFINLDKDSFRFIQLHSSSSFNSLLQNIPFYNYTTAPLAVFGQ